MGALKNRIAWLEARVPKVRLDDVPEEVRERRLALLLQMYAHAEAGLDIEDYRRERQAMAPLGVDLGTKRRTTDEELHKLVVDTLQSEPANAEYGRLLGLLPETEKSLS